jgi:hypothetical protein
MIVGEEPDKIALHKEPFSNAIMTSLQPLFNQAEWQAGHLEDSTNLRILVVWHPLPSVTHT